MCPSSSFALLEFAYFSDLFVKNKQTNKLAEKCIILKEWFERFLCGYFTESKSQPKIKIYLSVCRNFSSHSY